MAEPTPDQEAQVSHWIDLHNMTCLDPDCEYCRDHRVDSDEMWAELEYLEEIDIPIGMPKLGQHVHVMCGDAVLAGPVVGVYQDKLAFVVSTKTGHRWCTVTDLVR
jgi:hypothetical protein